MPDGNLGTRLTPAFADKLVKVLGMLGSAYDGEIAAAGRRAHSMLKAEGLTWQDLLHNSSPERRDDGAGRRRPAISPPCAFSGPRS
jgi:hypothetical protein